MAHQIQVETLSSTWDVNTHINSIIGKGAYGIIHRGTDVKGNPIAAKSINGADHSKIFTRDLDKLLQLNHPNIIKIFDIHRQGDTFWMFMELCSMGDLNKFFNQPRNLSDRHVLEIMTQIARGLEYLHRLNIIHRDIKPANILVADVFPLLIKMTDFDVSKFFDPDVETSEMSSNVGTLAFKALEFFQRGEDGKLHYRRYVDIYSLALTYLAMVQRSKCLKAEQRNKDLIPRIETPQDNSELHNPIGSTIANRVKFGVNPLDIVAIVDEANNATFENDIKKLIKKMTCVQPKDRLSIGEVLHILETKVTCGDTEIQKEISLDRVSGWTSDSCGISMVINKQDHVIIRAKIDDDWEFFRIMNKGNGKVVKDIKSLCNHGNGFINEHPSDPDYLLEICPNCEAIRAYNTVTGKGKIVYQATTPWQMCPGPADSLLVVDINHHVLQLKWENEVFKLAQTLTSHVENVKLNGMCYVEKDDILVMITLSPRSIKAIKLDGSHLWEVSGEVAGLEVHPIGICSYKNGHIYIADGGNNRLLLLGSSTGEVLQDISMELTMGWIWNVRWSDTAPHIVVLHGESSPGYTVSFFNVAEH